MKYKNWELKTNGEVFFASHNGKLGWTNDFENIKLVIEQIDFLENKSKNECKNCGKYLSETRKVK